MKKFFLLLGLAGLLAVSATAQSTAADTSGQRFLVGLTGLQGDIALVTGLTGTTGTWRFGAAVTPNGSWAVDAAAHAKVQKYCLVGGGLFATGLRGPAGAKADTLAVRPYAIGATPVFALGENLSVQVALTGGLWLEKTGQANKFALDLTPAVGAWVRVFWGNFWGEVNLQGNPRYSIPLAVGWSRRFGGGSGD